jgi:hypothetical protein
MYVCMYVYVVVLFVSFQKMLTLFPFPWPHRTNKKYMDCLHKSNDVHHMCKDLSKGYLQCRMDHQLMSQENLNNVSNEGVVRWKLLDLMVCLLADILT